MEVFKHIKRLIPWEWKYYTKRWIGSFFFDKREFEKNKKIILDNIKKYKEEDVSIDLSKLPNKKLKIIYSIHQFFPNHYAGTERYLLNLATEMKKMGHKVLIVTYIPNPTEEIKNSKEFYSNKYNYEGLEVIEIYSPNQKTNDSLMEENQEIRNFYSTLFEKEKPDVFHIAHPMYAYEGFQSAKGYNIKTVITLTDYWMLCKNIFLRRNDTLPCFGPKKGIECKKFCYRNLSSNALSTRYINAKKILEECDIVITATRFLVEIFSNNYITFKDLRIIPHSSNIQSNINNNHKIKNGFVFGYTGTLIPFKGVHTLINAYIEANLPQSYLYIYGDPNQDKEYSSFLKRLSLNNKSVIFKGKYSSNELIITHSELDVVVVPSEVFENYPISGINALRMGIPVIVPDLSGANELIKNHNNGYSYEFSNQTSLRDALTRAYKDNINFNTDNYSYVAEATLTLKTYAST